MTNRQSQCPNCGHYFSDDHPFYSEDFARTFLEAEGLGILWCLHCKHISEYRQAKLLFVKLPRLKYRESYRVELLNEKEYSKSSYGSMGGLFGFHVLRMIWHAVEARAKLEHGPNHTELKTVEQLLKSLPAPQAAFAVLAVSNTNNSLTLEERIYYGIYQEKSGWEIRSETLELVNSNPHLPGSEIVSEILTEAQS